MYFESDQEFYKEGASTGQNSGFDLYLPDDVAFYPNKVTFVDFKIKMTPTSGSGFWLMPRSSISKTPLRMANSLGLIDPTYRGNLIAAIENTSDALYALEKGTRIVQVCLPSLMPFTLTKVEHLTDTDRGAGGFGSTGK
jgi:dUTP pyrophosphatase